ncbi:hypothetical protein C8R45DRAFT_1073087 [Mycena sanguinolenta]|nr:hypothetical protein C8R45DRAFT_1073087 [Mycena sanguinolenta]
MTDCPDSCSESPQTTATNSPMPDALTPADVPWILFEGRRVLVPPMTIAKFCEQYHVNDSIRALLETAEFETAGSLLDVTEETLKEVGLKHGNIAELKRALREFLSARMMTDSE